MHSLFGAPQGGSGSGSGGSGTPRPPGFFQSAVRGVGDAAAAAAAAATRGRGHDKRASEQPAGAGAAATDGAPAPVFSADEPQHTSFPSGDSSHFRHLTAATPRTPTRRGGGGNGSGSSGGGASFFSPGGPSDYPGIYSHGGGPDPTAPPPPSVPPPALQADLFVQPGPGRGDAFEYPDVHRAPLAVPAPPGGDPRQQQQQQQAAAAAAGGKAGSFRVSPFQVAAAAAGRGAPRAIWSPRQAPKPFNRTFSPVAFLIFLGFLAATGYYFYIRVKFSLDMGRNTWWGVIVLIAEIFGLSAVMPYGFLLWLHTQPSGSRGLPLDDGRVVLPPEKRFNVHILVPCYKESLEVMSATVSAALSALVPPGVTRTVYICDDGKDPKKAAFAASLGPAAKYVTGRTRQPGEINGKSANVNNCLRNVIYPETHDQPDQIPWTEMVVVFDADMQAKRNFLLKILECMWEDSVALTLTPQAFSNIDPKADIFNNINQQFWEYVLPGCDAWGYVACTGTNFCIRSRALSKVGWFPEYTITEDYALSMELKAAGFKGKYLAQYLAVGEAPDEIRNVCRQRSRWTKGHMQIFFSRRCPLINGRLPLIHKWLYTNGTWSYFCTIITTAVFVLVPFNSLVFGLHPVAFSMEFALAATIYLPMNFLLMNYVHRPAHLKGQWMANISNHVLCFTYMKAVINTLLALFGVKEKAGFKATKKQGGSAPAAAPLTAPKPAVLPPLGAVARAAAQPPPQQPQRGGGWGRGAPAGGRGGKGAPAGRGQHYLPRQQPQAKPPAAPQPRGCWLWINAKTLEGALDPLALLISLCISLAAVGAGIYTIIKSKTFDVQVNSWQDFGHLFTEGRLDVYTLVPIFWALYNAIPPALFFVYFFTKGRLLRFSCSVAQVLGMLLAIGCILCLWLALLIPYRGPQQSTAFAAVSNAIAAAMAQRQNQQQQSGR